MISIGNLTVGGTGKTPLVELAARLLVTQGRHVVVLSRGYGRARGADVELVSDGTRLCSSVERAGDEPVLLARRLVGVPVVVGADRLRAGRWALTRFSPDVLVLDDGFQQRRLRKDVEVVCVDARAPWGAGGLLPRGSLREPPAALARADLLVLTNVAPGLDLARVTGEIRAWAPTAPLVAAGYEVEGVEEPASGRLHPVEALRGRIILAFAGIAVPESLGATLAAHGVVPRELVGLPDHHRYQPGDLRALARRARAIGAEILLTTEKDAVRLPGGEATPIWVLRVRLRLREGEEAWRAALGAGAAAVRLGWGNAP